MNNDNPLIPLSAIRAIAVEAIREVTGCPDISNHGKHLSDVMEAVAKAAAQALRTTSQPGGVPEGPDVWWLCEADNIKNGATWTRQPSASDIAWVDNATKKRHVAHRLVLLTAAPHPPAQQAEPLKADFVKAARVFALAYGKHADAPSYLPTTDEAASTFEPHGWVIAAMMQAYRDGLFNAPTSPPPHKAEGAEPGAEQGEVPDPEAIAKAADYDRVAWLSRLRRIALENIAGMRPLTATPEQFARHLQREAQRCLDAANDQAAAIAGTTGADQKGDA